MPTIILFDVDGTLVLTGGAGVRAMDRSFSDLFGVVDAFAGVPMPGRTDSLILADAAARHAIPLNDEVRDRFRMRYCAYLREEIDRPGPHKGIMPGVRPLLDALSRRDDVFLALLTGNYAAAARIKLEYFDLWRYFRCGAFGEDASDRDHLVPVALARARARGAPDVAARDVWVVGDTPLDVACARAAGARPIGVTTGSCDRAMLGASGAEVVFSDLSDLPAFLRLLGAGGEAARQLQ